MNIVCSITVSRLEFVSVTSTDILQSNLYKMPFVEWRVTRLNWKRTKYSAVKFHKIFIFIVFIFTGPILDLNWMFWKKCFYWEWMQARQMPFFQIICPKNAPLPPMPRIGPGLIFFTFHYSLFTQLTSGNSKFYL